MTDKISYLVRIVFDAPENLAKINENLRGLTVRAQYKQRVTSPSQRLYRIHWRELKKLPNVYGEPFFLPVTDSTGWKLTALLADDPWLQEFDNPRWSDWIEV